MVGDSRIHPRLASRLHHWTNRTRSNSFGDSDGPRDVHGKPVRRRRHILGFASGAGSCGHRRSHGIADDSGLCAGHRPQHRCYGDRGAPNRRAQSGRRGPRGGASGDGRGDRRDRDRADRRAAGAPSTRFHGRLAFGYSAGLKLHPRNAGR